MGVSLQFTVGYKGVSGHLLRLRCQRKFTVQKKSVKKSKKQHINKGFERDMILPGQLYTSL